MNPAWAQPRVRAVEARLKQLFADAWPQPFAAMAQHPIGTGGKRVRPLLCLGAAEAVGGNGLDSSVIECGAAIELLHTYSLVHDDLPCMDDDAERRGQPTTHIVYGEAMALLVGDALLTEAFRLLSAPGLLPSERQLAVVRELSSAGGYHGMIGGQVSDLGGGGPVTDLDTLLRLHRGKTGALIRGAVRIGAIAAGAGAAELAALTRYGEAVGLAFQLADDVLDAEQDAGSDGPPSFVKLLGVEETGRRARALAEEAVAALDGLEATPLVELARFTVERSV